MYTVSKGPSKIVAKSRRGLSQNYEKFETIKESGRKSSDYYSPEKISTPRPVFQTTKKAQTSIKQLEEEYISPQHEELIKYISDSWNIAVAKNPYDETTTCNGGVSKVNGHADNNNNCSNFDATRIKNGSVVSNGVMTNGSSSSLSTSGVSSASVTSSSSPPSSYSSMSLSSSSSLSCSSTNTSPASSPQPLQTLTLTTPAATSSSYTANSTTILYCVEPPSPVLKDFKPFDLEAWWGRRLFNNITKTI